MSIVTHRLSRANAELAQLLRDCGYWPDSIATFNRRDLHGLGMPVDSIRSRIESLTYQRLIVRGEPSGNGWWQHRVNGTLCETQGQYLITPALADAFIAYLDAHPDEDLAVIE